jgi:hypothetical protein
MHCALSETEYGMLPRTCREIFNKMKVQSLSKIPLQTLILPILFS